MAPIKFEEHLKEKLEKRTIQPSDEAWNALANRLDQHDKNQNRKTFWWLGIAASIVGIGLAVFLIFDTSQSTPINPTVVDVEKNEAVKSNAVASENVEAQELETATNSAEEVRSSTKQKPILKETRDQKKEIILKEAVASADVKVQEQKQNASEISAIPSDFEESKLNEVVAEIQKLNNEKQGVSEAELDSLLKQAEREILTNRIYNENTKTVDANALLQGVEEELEQTFRTKVFEVLKTSYVTVKTAVAERNN